MDELGRGTSTFDGYAIAKAVLDNVIHNRSLCLFTTHYHMLTSQFAHHPQLKNFHMSYKINQDEEITFLYRFTEGVCSSSFGIKVAKHAGIPDKVIQLALH